VGEKLDAMWESAKAQFAAMPGAAARDAYRDIGNTYQSVLLANSSLSVVHPPGSTQMELSELHKTAEVAEPAPEPEGDQGMVGLDEQLGGYSGPDMDKD
jgi:hypothetical protein